jgi:hypothetical protein
VRKPADAFSVAGGRGLPKSQRRRSRVEFRIELVKLPLGYALQALTEA